MSLRSSAIALGVLIATTALAPGWARAQQKSAKAKPSVPSPIFLPNNIKRAVVQLTGVSGATVTLRTPQGATFSVLAFNPSLLLFKNGHLAGGKDVKPGDKLVVYYNVPAAKQDPKLLWAAADPASEIILAELRTKPTPATFKSFDAASNKLTVQMDGRAKTLTMVAPIMAIRQMKEAILGAPTTKDKQGYAPGDKLLLVMTADGKRVRMVTDSLTYDRYAQGLKKFPIPPVSKLATK